MALGFPALGHTGIGGDAAHIGKAVFQEKGDGALFLDPLHVFLLQVDALALQLGGAELGHVGCRVGQGDPLAFDLGQGGDRPSSWER